MALSSSPPARYDHHTVVRAHARTADDLALIARASDDIWSHRLSLGHIDAMVDPEGLAALRASGVPHRVLIEDVQRAIDNERAPAHRGATDDWFADYHTYAEFSLHADSLVALRPDLCARVHVGQSLQGREIFALRITAPGDASQRPAFFINGCQHAREWVAAATPMFIADALVRSHGKDETLTHLVNSVEFLIVPIVNPDGYVHTWTDNRLWRKNRRANGDGSIGVDLNRNWGHQWGGQGASALPSSPTYAGASPFSEPETQALRDFIEARPRIRATIDFHSYGQLVMSPWAWTTSPALDASFMNELATDAAAAFTAVHDNYHQPGPVAQILYHAAGSAGDWSYAARAAWGLGVELRDTGEHGFVLPADQIRPTGEEALAGVRVIAQRLAQPPGPFTLVAPAHQSLAEPSSSTLRWTHSAHSALYRVTVSRHEDLSSPVYESTVRAALSATIPATALEEGARYWWTIAAVGAALPAEPTSGPRSFRVRTRADLNADGRVDHTDLGILIGSWGLCPGACPSDINRDSRVDSTDLALLLGRWD